MIVIVGVGLGSGMRKMHRACPNAAYGKGVSANLRQGASWKLDQ